MNPAHFYACLTDADVRHLELATRRLAHQALADAARFQRDAMALRAELRRRRRRTKRAAQAQGGSA